MAGPDYDSLARAHMAQQVRDAGVIQLALARYWTTYISPNDLDGSFARFVKAAQPLITAGRLRGEVTAQQYYAAVKQLAGLGGPLEIPNQDAELEATLAALQSTGLAVAKSQIKNGSSSVEQALAAAQASMLRSSKRRVLGAGRQRLIDLANKDKQISGWARVGDGNPCYFCAMLISRGPVYKVDTVGFRAHDGCGCSVKVVARNDPSKGWSADAKQLRDLWDNGGYFDWRTTYNNAVNPQVSEAPAQAA